MVKEVVQSARILERWDLTKGESKKKVFHLSLEHKKELFSFVVGDCIAIYPENSSRLVKAILDKSGLDPLAHVEKKGERGTLFEFFSSKLMITSLSRSVLEQSFIKGKWGEFPQEEWKSLFSGWDLLDLFERLGKGFFEPQELVNELSPLLPRFYSIASSPVWSGDKIDLTIGAIEYLLFDRLRKGVASEYLASDLLFSTPISFFHHPHRGFTLREPERPIIMVGPGTGIAPFRGFVQERWITRSSKKNWLFFGEWNRRSDFLYEEEWEIYQKEGFLEVDTAFSRDQSEKIYVQHRMQEQSKKLFRWLEEEAIFYVCGDKERMAKDVEKTLIEIIEREGRVNGRDYLRKMRDEKRYLRDVY